MLLVLLLTSVFTRFSGMTVEVLGTVLGTAVQGQIVGGAPDCPIDLNGNDSNNETNVNMTSGFLEETVSFLTGSSSLSDWWSGFLRELHGKNGSRLTPSLRPQKQAYLIASGVICVIYVLCAAVLFLGVKEQKGMEP